MDTGATITDTGGNLIGTAAAPIDPLLGPLADNGGPTCNARRCSPGSPAINAGDPNAVAGVGGVPLVRSAGRRRLAACLAAGSTSGRSSTRRPAISTSSSTRWSDESDGNYALGDLSLREAIVLANTYPGTDTIRFDPALTQRRPRFS